MNTQTFYTLMQTVVIGWNTKNAQKAVACFTPDAVYIEPPDKQLFKGKNELYEYFGGDAGFDMRLTWHHLFFDEAKQIGAGEYTFVMKDVIHHGMVVIELEEEKIKLWREYDTSGNLSRKDFVNTDGKHFRFTIKELKK